jgi:hypothetical protein
MAIVFSVGIEELLTSKSINNDAVAIYSSRVAYRCKSVTIIIKSVGRSHGERSSKYYSVKSALYCQNRKRWQRLIATVITSSSLPPCRFECALDM